jgi:hypothetical protein
MSLLAPEPPANVRCSDGDREKTVTILQNNAAVGRITPEELSTRLDKAFAAKTVGDLRAIVSDLPEGNVDPVAQMMTGMVSSGMRIAKVGLWITVGAAVLGIAAPIVAGLALTGHGLAALIAVGAIVLLVFVAAHGHRRRRRSS